jgi:hypothetical protein
MSRCACAVLVWQKSQTYGACLPAVNNNKVFKLQYYCAKTMSNYFITLGDDAKKRYLAKLKCIGLDDPYLESGDWVDDVRKWPSLEFGAIYVYLIDSPGPFTRENLHAYRSLEAYNYFVSGWVQKCLLRRSKSGYAVFKAKVLRSQSVTDKPHHAWVAIRESDGSVQFAHCTCMAG